MMTKVRRDRKFHGVRLCNIDCRDCRDDLEALRTDADEMDAFLRELDAMLARGELATAVQTKVRGALKELERT